MQTARLASGQRKVLNVAECLGLDSNNQYVLKDVYKFVAESTDANGKILGSLQRAGHIPTFASDPFSRGLGDQVKETLGVFVPK